MGSGVDWHATGDGNDRFAVAAFGGGLTIDMRRERMGGGTIALIASGKAGAGIASHSFGESIWTIQAGI